MPSKSCWNLVEKQKMLQPHSPQVGDRAFGCDAFAKKTAEQRAGGHKFCWTKLGHGHFSTIIAIVLLDLLKRTKTFCSCDIPRSHGESPNQFNHGRSAHLRFPQLKDCTTCMATRICFKITARTTNNAPTRKHFETVF